MLRSSCAVIALLMGHGAAFAQTAEEGILEPRGGGEIVVTAQKRSQNLQDVPIAVSAIGADTLETAAIVDIADLQTSVPSLNVYTANRPSTSTSFILRGVGTAGSDSGLEGAVGFFVDGVYRSRSGTGLGDFIDLDRVEVLRGPQGTLFGKNTSAGAIAVETKSPTNEFEGFLEFGAGNYEARRVSGAVNVPLIDEKLALRVAGSFNRRDGFLVDSVTGDRYNDRDRWAVRGKLLFTPVETLDVELTIDYAEADESCCQSVRLSNTPNSPIVPFLAQLAAAAGSAYPVNPNPDVFATAVNGPAPVADFTDEGYALEINWDLGFGTLTSLSSYRDFDSLSENDVDFSGADLLYQRLGFDSQIFSQELRLQGRYEGLLQGLDWLVGFYFSDERIGYFERPELRPGLQPYFSALLGNPALGALYPAQVDAFGNFSEQDGTTFAVFAHNILDITDKLSFTGGLRFTTDDKTASSDTFWNHPAGQLPFTGLGLPFAQHNSYSDLNFKDSDVTWTVGFDYDWTDDLMTYVSAGHGYKAGGFVLNREAAGLAFSSNPECSADQTVAVPAGGGLPTIFRCDPFDPRFGSETVNSYEIGLRSQWFDRALTVNLTGFYARYQDLQLNTFNGFSFTIQNAGTAATRGAELETLWRTPIEGLNLGANVSYTDARFGDEVGVIQPGEPPVGDEPLPNAPRWSTALTVDYSRTVFGSSLLFFRGEYSYTSAQETSTRIGSSGEPLRAEEFDLTNAALGLELPRGVEFALYCRNCFDERYTNFIFNTVAQPGSKDQFISNPLEFGLRARKTF